MGCQCDHHRAGHNRYVPEEMDTGQTESSQTADEADDRYQSERVDKDRGDGRRKTDNQRKGDVRSGGRGGHGAAS